MHLPLHLHLPLPSEIDKSLQSGIQEINAAFMAQKVFCYAFAFAFAFALGFAFAFAFAFALPLPLHLPLHLVSEIEKSCFKAACKR